jgi:hypothetical protein
MTTSAQQNAEAQEGNPFEQIAAAVQVSRTTRRKVQLAVSEFQEAEHLDLMVQHTEKTALNG